MDTTSFIHWHEGGDRPHKHSARPPWTPDGVGHFHPTDGDALGMSNHNEWRRDDGNEYLQGWLVQDGSGAKHLRHYGCVQDGEVPQLEPVLRVNAPAGYEYPCQLCKEPVPVVEREPERPTDP